MESKILILDSAGKQVGECLGPDSQGSCPRVAKGEVVCCAGSQIKRRGEKGKYVVSNCATLCPLTLADSLGVPLTKE